MYTEIITPQKMLYSGKVYLIQLPGKEGLFEIMHKHAPVISVLTEGSVKVIEQKGEQAIYFDITGGVVKVEKNKAIVMAETE